MKYRRTITLRSSLLSAIGSILFCFSSVFGGTLPEITKPYTGEYRCVDVRLGDDDYLDNFRYIKLELCQDGEFCIRYQTSSGVSGEKTGRYRYIEKEGKVYFSSNNTEMKITCVLEKGVLTACIPVGERVLFTRFQRGG